MTPFTPEQDQYLQIAQTRAYYKGVREGVNRYAHWKDGVQYVGTTGRTLNQAIAELQQEEVELIERYERLAKA